MRIEINAEHPEPRKIARAVAALEAGHVIAYPTDTVYAIGCDLANKRAIESLYVIKQMPREQPLSFVVPDLSEVARYAVVQDFHYRFIKHLIPGPYTFILEATREVPKLVQSKKKTVGIRVPNHEVVIAIVRELGRPVITSTAVLPGEDPMIDPHEIDDQFRGLAMVLDGGVGGLVPTTIVDLSTGDIEVVREGAGPIDELG